MKKLFILLLIINNLQLFGQYSFNVTKGTYSQLSNSISLNNGKPWTYESSYPLYFNFNFKILNQTYTALNVMSGGGLSFPGLGDKQFLVFSHTESGYLLEDRDSKNSASPISYEIVGNEGQKILKIEWKNAGFRQICTTSYDADYVNFQIWLYEGTNRLEIHFGDNLASKASYGNPDCNTGTDGPQILFQFDKCSNSLSLTGPCALPSYDFRNHCGWEPGIHINGTPAPGLIYNFSPAETNMMDESNLDVQIPNPINNTLIISHIPEEFKIKEISLIDILGKIRYKDSKIQNNGKTIQLDFSYLKSGIYYLKLYSVDNKVISKKVLST